MYKFITTLVLLGTLVASAAFASSEGENLFKRYCITCHANVDTVRIGRTKIQDALRPGTIKKHRFTLTDNEQDALLNYLLEESR